VPTAPSAAAPKSVARIFLNNLMLRSFCDLHVCIPDDDARQALVPQGVQ
jgi:hypothetical protein